MPTATLSLGTFANDATAGDNAWSNPSNAATQNTTYAQVSNADLQTSQRLKCTNQSGATAIADAATITAVRVYVRGKSTNAASTRIQEIYLVKAGTTQTGATNLAATPQNLTTSDATYTFGGSGTHGVTLTGADVKNSGFGCSIRIEDISTDEGSEIVNVDHVYMDVDYTNPTYGLQRARGRLMMYMRRILLAD